MDSLPPNIQSPQDAIPDVGRTVELRFHAGDFEGGNVPIAVLAQKLQALQSLMYHASASVSGSRVPRLGQWVAKHRDVAELAFAESQPGSLITRFVLRNADPTLFALQARTLGVAVAALTAGAAGQLPQGISREDAIHLMQAVEDLCPSTFDDYQIDVRVGDSPMNKVALTRETRIALRDRLKDDDATLHVDEPELIYGVLVQSNFGKGDDKIVIRAARVNGDSGSVEIDCYYPDHLRDQVANLVGGSLVEVFGFVTGTADGSVNKFREVLSIEMMDTEPIRLRTLQCDGTLFRFRTPFSFDVEYVGGVWAYSNTLLNVSGFAMSRQAALNELSQAMAYVWREFALADDAELDAKALELKRRLVDTIEAVSIAGGAS